MFNDLSKGVRNQRPGTMAVRPLKVWEPLLVLLEVSLSATPFTIGTNGRPPKWSNEITFNSSRERVDSAGLGDSVDGVWF